MCVYVWLSVCMYVDMPVRTCACMYVPIYVWIYVFVYVCMYHACLCYVCTSDGP